MTLRNIKSAKNFAHEIDENSTVFSDTEAYGGNSMFKIKIRQLGDLAGTPGKGTPEPVKAFAEGDVVRGVGMDDKKEHEGAIIAVTFDEESEECTDLSIEENGQMYKLIPTSVKMVKDNGADNDEKEENKPVDTNQPTVAAYTFETLRTWKEFE